MKNGKIIRIPQRDFLGYDTELAEQVIRIILRKAGFDFSLPIKRWTDLETMDEVFQQEEVEIDKPKKRISELVRTVFQTKRIR